jgi:hypothetical protein
MTNAHPLKGRKQSPEHIAKRTASVIASLRGRTEEEKEAWRENVSNSKKGNTPWNKGLKGVQEAWNKGNNWRDNFTPEEIRAKNAERQRRRLSNNSGLRIHSAVSCLMRQSLNGNKNGRKWEQIVGYTLDDLKNHLEAQFREGMSFDNFGEWHIDHIKPRAAFDFQDENDPDFLDCWKLENLQPLWKHENLKKGSKYPIGVLQNDQT